MIGTKDVFIPSFYAVMSLIKCYLKNKKETLKIYNLKNAVVRKEIKKDKEIYYGGLPFILKYLEMFSKDASIADIKSDFTDIMEELIDCKSGLEINEKDEFINDIVIGDYKILKHRDVEKDWKHLKEGQIKKSNAIIDNTPKFPKNEPPKNDPLHTNIKGWFSQRVSQKDRVVYRKDSTEKVIYIATVCNHYKDAERRSKSKESYR